jgi:hypothetical protein
MLLCAAAAAAQEPSREQVLAAMEKATDFYAGRVAIHGGFHFSYTDDLSYARSEQGEGLTQIETQRQGTPIAGMAFLEAWEATKNRKFLDAARRVAHALVAGQLCSGGWDYIVEFDAGKRKAYPYRQNGCDGARNAPPTTLDDNVTQACLRLLMRVDRELDFSDKAIHEAALFALDSLAKAQYANGAWPQRYSEPPKQQPPARKASYPESWPRQWPGASYQGFYTFNDNSIADAIDAMLEAALRNGRRNAGHPARSYASLRRDWKEEVSGRSPGRSRVAGAFCLRIQGQTGTRAFL